MISVITPTLNEEKYLPKLLASLKKQTYQDIELIVADNHSRDKTRKIAKSYGCRIVDGGLPAKARNNGAKHAKGDIFLFLDADVVLDSDTFLSSLLSEFKAKGLSVGTCIAQPISSNIIDKFLFAIINLGNLLFQNLNPHAMGFCIFITKEAFFKIGGFDESMWHAEDHDLARRASRIGKFGVLRSNKISVSVRRFDKEGRFKVVRKAILSELHILFRRKLRKDAFEYSFGDYR